ncbi:MAG: ATP-binding protein [Marinifilaceae bacterium]
MEGKEVVVIEVVSGSQKPYTLSGAIYVRQGPNSQKILSVEQMRDFFQQSSRIYFDEASCAEFDSEKDIDDVTFEEFRIDAGLSRSASREQIISNLRLLSVDGVFKNGAVLFFGKSPEDFIEKAVLRCVAFDGTDKTYIVDDKIYTGSLIRQYNHVIQWLKTKLDVSYEIEGTGPRKEHWEIPRTVFKEAIINALTHRDYYDKGARLTVELFTDRVEITNPGGLVSAISKKEFGFKSHSRNPLIFGLFERMHMVEQIGSGINRMRRAMEVADLNMPIFKTEGMFTVVLKRPITKSSEKGSEKSSEKGSEKNWELKKSFLLKELAYVLNETEWEILKLIFDNNRITISELAKERLISTRSIEKNIKKLKEKDILERVGADKGGFWKIKKL